MSEQKVYAPPSGDDEKTNGFGLLAGENLVFADGENMWQSLLERVTSQATQRDKVLLVLGASRLSFCPRPVVHGAQSRPSRTSTLAYCIAEQTSRRMFRS